MLTLTPVTLATANAFVNAHHRHHKATAGHKFSIGCAKDGDLVGVAIVGRPVSRYLDNGWTLEVNRLCTTGEKNACSILYAASARAAKAMGYYRAIGTGMTLLPEDFNLLTSIEDVIMIGYPNGIIDTYNNKPVVRKGITATSLKLDYDGTPDFVIDISCFFGSSGSPVFLRKEGLAKETSDKGLTLGLTPSYSLLGIIHSMSIAKADGNIVQKDIPTSLKSVVETNIPLNLGYVTKAKKILEIFDIVKGTKKEN